MGWEDVVWSFVWAVCIATLLLIALFGFTFEPRPIVGDLGFTGLTGPGDSYIVLWDKNLRQVHVTEHLPADAEICLQGDCRLMQSWLTVGKLRQ